MTARETPILHAVRQALTQTGRVLLWRSNTGVDIKRGVRYGLGVGGADLIGIIRSPSAHAGRFISFEVKSPTGRLRPEQELWRRAVIDAGGFAAVVRSADDALEALDRALAGASQ